MINNSIASTINSDEEYETASLYDSLKKPTSSAISQDEIILLSTGIHVLDRNLGGGLPAGSLSYFSADPQSMSEVFLYQFTQSRKTFYFTTGRRPKYVLNDIINLGFDPGNIIFVDIYSEYYFSSCGEMVESVGNEYMDSKIIEFTEYNLRNIANDSSDEIINIIIDSFSFFMNLNVNPGIIRQLTNVIYEVTKEIQCLTYLYGQKGNNPAKMDSEAFAAVDVIFDSSLEKGPDKMVSKLAIPKIRGMVPNTDIIKFKIGEGVQIDTSRDIA
ncbi:RAD55 family ATPase [Methanolobus halotolerans]|uniref:RAD55 family ATPase n=1 Tax=Methanolobus halotolerans TaxID=2052935 RepID=UPI001F2953C5|nr:RAD55 family ATPase [Methanolobus halotolerans]